MSLQGSYDEQNIFAKIIRGEAPCYRIYEDEAVLAFLDVFPQSKGHALVISKTAQARNILEIDAKALTAVALATQKVAQAINQELQPDGIQVAQFNGAAAGQTVFHLHMHVIPRYSDKDLAAHAGGKAEAAELAALAQRLAERLA